MSKTIHETRGTETGRVPLSFQFGSRFDIPQEIKDADPDHVYGFIPDKTDGDEDSLDKAISQGWMLVKDSDNPELARKYFNPSVRKKSDRLLRKGGQVMMKMPKDIYESRERYYETLAAEQKKQADQKANVQHMTQNPLYGQGGQGVTF